MDKSTPRSPKPLVNVTCKLGTKGCFEDGRCHALGGCENKIVTNADRIRAMTDEELCEFLQRDEICDQKISRDCGPCDKCVMDWLRQEV